MARIDDNPMRADRRALGQGDMAVRPVPVLPLQEASLKPFPMSVAQALLAPWRLRNQPAKRPLSQGRPVMLRRPALALVVAFLAAGQTSAAPPILEAQRQAEACGYWAGVMTPDPDLQVIIFDPIEPLPQLNIPKGAERAVAEWRRKGATNLYTACPELKARLPATVRAATKDDFAIVNMGRPPRHVSFSGHMAPFISRDGRYLIISYRWYCTGLCGGYTALIRTREGAGWSKPHVLADAIS